MEQNGGPRYIMVLFLIKVDPAVKMMKNPREMELALISLMIHLLYYYHLRRMMKMKK
jgi:hypothetical protein